MAKILLLHPGEMGAPIGAELVKGGHQVCWVGLGRSNETQQRAANAGLRTMATLPTAVESVSVVLSVCPPEYAVDVAWSVAELQFSGTYVDANAIAPATASKVGALFGNNFVDGSLIGGPVSAQGAPHLYLSGDSAPHVAKLFEGSAVPVKVLDGDVTAASSLKMCYAAYTKGSSALLLNIRALAHALGVTQSLVEEWAHSQPEVLTRSERIGPGTSRKGWRFVAEMYEIADAFETVGLPGGFHRAAADVYGRMALFKDRPPASTDEVTATILQTESSQRD